MPRPRFEKAAPELKQAILTAAKKEFAQQGYDAASLNRILETAGLSKGAFYYYFDDKADLALTVMLDVYAPLLEASPLPEPASREEFWTALDAYSRRTLHQIERSPEKLALMSKLGSAMLQLPEFQQRILPMMAKPIADYSRLWQRGVALGAIRSDLPVPVQMALIQSIKEVLGRTLLPKDRDATGEELIHMASVQLDLMKRLCEPARDGKDPP